MKREILKSYNFQRRIGKVHGYDSVMGTIITDQEKYDFSFLGLNHEVKNGDMVTFIADTNGMATNIRQYNDKTLIKGK